jgi:hypothetical protein
VRYTCRPEAREDVDRAEELSTVVEAGGG